MNKNNKKWNVALYITTLTFSEHVKVTDKDFVMVR